MPLQEPLVISLAVWELYTEKPQSPELEKKSFAMGVPESNSTLQVFRFLLKTPMHLVGLKRAFYRCMHSLSFFLRPDKGRNYKHHRDYEETVARILGECFSGRYFEHWHCWRLATDPAWKRKGVGTALAKWGVDAAKEEAITAGLEATKEALPIYKSLGFELLPPVYGPLTFSSVMRKESFVNV